jgi:hypothetical protein
VKVANSNLSYPGGYCKNANTTMAGFVEKVFPAINEIL